MKKIKIGFVYSYPAPQIMKEIKIVNLTAAEQAWYGCQVVLEAASGRFPVGALCTVGDDGRYASTRGVKVKIGGNLGSRSVGISASEAERAVQLLGEAGHKLITVSSH